MPFGVAAYEGGIPYTQLFDYNGGASVVYIGWADPGQPTAAARWRIQLLSYDTNGNVTSIKFANGSVKFDQIWDNRANATYITYS